jgi:chromosome segregation ATPase
MAMHQHNNDPDQALPTQPNVTSSVTDGASSTSADTPGAGGTDDVMNILADVEKHIQRIKSAQREHDEELNTLEARFQSLKDAEREVEQRRKHVIEERGRLEQVQNALRDERVAFETDCNARRSAIDAERSALAQEREEIKVRQQEIAERFQAIEKQFTELSTLEQEIARERSTLETESQQTQTRCKQLIQQLDERQTELDKRDGELSAQRRRTELREQEITTELDRMRAEVRDFTARAGAAESAASEALETTRAAEVQLEAGSRELARLKDELALAHQSLAEERERSEKQQHEFEQEREQASEIMSELEESLAVSKRERESVATNLALLEDKHGELIEQHAKTEHLRGQLDEQVAQLNEKLSQRDKTLADSQQKLKLAGQKLVEFSEVLREQATQLEHAAAHKVTIRQQQQEIEHLCNELARYRLAADPEVIDRKDQRIAELTEALRQARGQSPADEDTSRLEHQVIELATALDDRALIIEQLQVQLEHAQRRASDDVSSEAREAGDAARVAGRDAKIQELTAEVHRLEHELSEHRASGQHADEASLAGAAEIEALQQRVRELESCSVDDADLTERLRELEHEAAQTAELQARIGELEESLQEAQSKSGKSGPSLKQLDEKVQRIRAAAEHLQRRRSRLKRVRQLIELRKPAGETRSQSTLEQIELAEQSIAEARSALAVSEREMMRRWARNRAAVAVSFVTILVTLLAAGSWFGADHFFPAKSTASVTLEAQTSGSKLLDGEAGARWSTWHAEMLSDLNFRTTLAKRMQERQLPQFGSITELDRVMKHDVTIDAMRPGEVTITMAGHDEQQLTHALDTLASTLAMASAREAGKRPDSARTVIRGERKEAGSTHYAQPTGISLEDERLLYSVIIFGATAAIALLCGVGVYTRLVKVKRIFEEEGRLT